MKTVDCQQVEAALTAYLKDGLSPARSQAVEDHLATCDACTRSVQQAQILESELRLQAARHSPTLSPEASVRIREQVYRRMRRGLMMQRIVKVAGVGVAVVAIVLLAVGAMALWQGRPPDTVDEQEVTPGLTESAPTLVPPTSAPATSEPMTPEPATSVPPTSEPEASGADAPYQTYTIGEDFDFALGAVADLNGDAHPDIAVADTGGGVLRLLFNQGDGTFEEVPEIATGDSPQGVTAADLDGEGHADLVVSHGALGDQAGHLSVMLNNGDGTFQAQVDYATVDNWFSSAVDVDGDADLDLVIEDATQKGPLGKYGAVVWLNNGDGTFEEGERYFLDVQYIGHVATGDLNGDTVPDLLIRHYPEPKVSIQLGNGDGSFGEPVEYETADRLQDVTVADLDGDSHPDLATGNSLGVVNVLLNNGDGTFQDRTDYDVGGDVMGIYAVDMGGDGSLDLVFDTSGGGNVGLLTNNGDGTFELTQEYYWKGIWLSSIAVCDVDGDGNLDLVGADSDSVYVIPLEDTN
jgi:hypothetical protein